jgi:hypothetical protein
MTSFSFPYTARLQNWKSCLAYRRLEAAVSAFGMPAWASGSRMGCPSLFAFIAAKRTMRESLASTSLVATVFRIVNGRPWCGHGTVAA